MHVESLSRRWKFRPLSVTSDRGLRLSIGPFVGLAQLFHFGSFFLRAAQQRVQGSVWEPLDGLSGAFDNNMKNKNNYFL